MTTTRRTEESEQSTGLRTRTDLTIDLMTLGQYGLEQVTADAAGARSVVTRSASPGRLLAVAVAGTCCEGDWRTGAPAWTEFASRLADCEAGSFVGSARRVAFERPRSSTSSPSSQSPASSPDASSTAADEARIPLPSRSFARSQSRAASLTASPITVYSKRSTPPMLPATTSP